MPEPRMQKLIVLLKGIRPECDYAASRSFIADGLLDSFDMIALVDSLDRSYGISIDGVDIVPENFENLASIASLLGKYGVVP